MSGLSTQARRNLRRKFADHYLPHRVDVGVPYSEVLTEVLAVEQKLEEVLTRRHADAREALRNSEPKHAYLRVCVHHTWANVHPAEAEATGEPPSWTLKVTGQLLKRAEGDEWVPADVKMARFSDFWSKLFVQLDDRAYPGLDSTIEWHKAQSPAAFCGFEVHREGGRPTDVVISLFRDHCPRKFRVSRPLSKLVDVREASKPLAMALVWRHVRAAGLVERANPRKLRVDDVLREALEMPAAADLVTVEELFSLLDLQLLPPEPLMIKYAVRFDADPADLARTYDIPVELPPHAPPPETPPAGLPPLSANLAEVERLDNEAQRLVLELHRYRRRQHMFMALHDAPVQAVEMISSALARGADGVDPYGREAMRMARTYEEDWVPDAVDRFFAAQQRHAEEERKRLEAEELERQQKAHAERQARRQAKRQKLEQERAAARAAQQAAQQPATSL